MNMKMIAALLTAAAGPALLTGCGSGNNMTNAENAHTMAVTETSSRTNTTTARGTDRDNSLYEEDDVHRKTDVSEPDILDRTESALDDAEDVVTSMMTEAKEELDDMHD